MNTLNGNLQIILCLKMYNFFFQHLLKNKQSVNINYNKHMGEINV